MVTGSCQNNSLFNGLGKCVEVVMATLQCRSCDMKTHNFNTNIICTILRQCSINVFNPIYKTSSYSINNDYKDYTYKYTIYISSRVHIMDSSYHIYNKVHIMTCYYTYIERHTKINDYTIFYYILPVKILSLKFCR